MYYHPVVVPSQGRQDRNRAKQVAVAAAVLALGVCATILISANSSSVDTASHASDPASLATVRELFERELSALDGSSPPPPSGSRPPPSGSRPPPSGSGTASGSALGPPPTLKALEGFKAMLDKDFASLVALAGGSGPPPSGSGPPPSGSGPPPSGSAPPPSGSGPPPPSGSAPPPPSGSAPPPPSGSAPPPPSGSRPPPSGSGRASGSALGPPPSLKALEALEALKAKFDREMVALAGPPPPPSGSGPPPPSGSGPPPPSGSGPPPPSGSGPPPPSGSAPPPPSGSPPPRSGSGGASGSALGPPPSLKELEDLKLKIEEGLFALAEQSPPSGSRPPPPSGSRPLPPSGSGLPPSGAGLASGSALAPPASLRALEALKAKFDKKRSS